MPERETRSGLIHIAAECQGCKWESTAANALGNAARHHDATGHVVRVEVTRGIIYGDPSAPLPGQLSLGGEPRGGVAALDGGPVGQER